MKITAKEKLNDKARKIIDLVYDEVCNGGESSITSSFVGKNTNLKYELTVDLKVTDAKQKVTPEGPSFSSSEDDGLDESNI